ncbi:MAG: response regulator [Gammaproteobacteria bacterium]|nr:response regulator [Gammaproteobacteria bacterium]
MSGLLKKILYIEDEPDITAIATVALETVGGFDLKSCSSGFQAIEEIHQFNPDLILLDVMMPDLDGPSTLTKIRELEQFRDTPAIFMTAKAQPDDIKQLKAMGVLDVITKPFDPMTLSKQINQIWENAA